MNSTWQNPTPIPDANRKTKSPSSRRPYALPKSNKRSWYLFSILLLLCLGVLGVNDKHKNTYKRTDWGGRIQLSLSLDNISIYTENHKGSQNFSELVCSIKVVG